MGPAHCRRVHATAAEARAVDARGRAEYVILGVALLCALIPGVLAPEDANKIGVGDLLEAPSAAHLLGTDEFGRDILSRIIFSARIERWPRDDGCRGRSGRADCQSTARRVRVRRRRKPSVALILGLAVIALVILCAAVPSLLAPYDPNELATGELLSPPAADHLLGTDEFGRDLFEPDHLRQPQESRSASLVSAGDRVGRTYRSGLRLPRRLARRGGNAHAGRVDGVPIHSVRHPRRCGIRHVRR